MNSSTEIPRSTCTFLKASSDICGFEFAPPMADWPQTHVVPRRHKTTVPTAQRIVRLHSKLILPPYRCRTFTKCAEPCGVRNRLERTRFCLVVHPGPGGRAEQSEVSLGWFGSPDTIRRPAFVRNRIHRAHA